MKKERGSVTIITLTTILFIIAFVVSTFTIIANRRQAQAEIKKETQAIYESDVDNAEQIYQSYFANENEVIPIQTADQLFSIATNKNIVSGNKIYKYTADADYRLVNDISFNVSDYITKYPGEFQNSTNWIDIEQQIEKGVFTGTFDYNGNEIIETDANGKTIIHSIINYVEYLESTGTQYIDTGMIANQDTCIEMLVATTTDVSNAGNGVGFIPYGAAVFYNDSAFECYSHEGQFQINYNNQNAWIGTVNVGETISISHNRNVINITKGTTQYSYNFEDTDFETPRTITLFAINRTTAYEGANVLVGKARIYSCKIYDNGVLVRNFLPALDENNVPCLYDKVTAQYFYNAGTGTFSYQ